MTASMLKHALALALQGYEVFPLVGKVPAIAGGRGCLDATTDVEAITRHWTARPRANIGLRLPVGQIVIDIDPRHDGHLGLQQLEAAHGPLPATRTAESGRGDGGRHFHFLAPSHPVTDARTPGGVDLKTRGGYVVAPPSLHPDSGRPYRWLDLREPVPTPDWLAELLKKELVGKAPTASPRSGCGGGTSVADTFTTATTWGMLLPPHGWKLRKGDGDENGSVWLHPDATSTCSATVTHGCLFVYSTSTPLPVTAAGDPNGQTRFRAWSVLNYGGNLSRAAHDLIDTVRGRAAGPAADLPTSVLDAVKDCLDRHVQDTLSTILGGRR